MRTASTLVENRRNIPYRAYLVYFGRSQLAFLDFHCIIGTGLAASVGVSFFFPFGQYWHTAAVVSPHPLDSSVLAWPLAVCFLFLGFLGLLGCRWATSLMIGDASLFGVLSLSLTAIVSTFQVLAFFYLFLRIVTLTCLLFCVTDYT